MREPAICGCGSWATPTRCAWIDASLESSRLFAQALGWLAGGLWPGPYIVIPMRIIEIFLSCNIAVFQEGTVQGRPQSPVDGEVPSGCVPTLHVGPGACTRPL